ncbi:MAG TPA: ATP-grasp domain-containing protein [Archangium sp.]|uniref:ATP-grasp domain-containing protein n=1 Tax=Archangium sp. TaxID=1872627 RepID=UPI002E2FEB91|nr:ATP-grasp domain-containing protein [Archangium sp.]HEX5752034.1 ATP-grasp domain-containing protein [Archangium sp.]
MSQPTILLLEKFSFYSTCAVARRAVEMGFAVVVVAPTTIPEHLVKDQPFELIRTDDWSSANLSALYEQLASTRHIVGINTILGFFTGQGLLGMQVAELARQHGLPHNNPEALLRANNKYLMRQTLQQAGVYTIRHALAGNDAELEEAVRTVGFPLIIKPLVGVGSSFISRCTTLQQAREVLRHYLENVRKGYYAHFFAAHEYQDPRHGTRRFDPLSQVLVEEAIDGWELSVEFLCTEDTAYPVLIHDKLDVTQEAYCSYENLLVTPPVRLDETMQQRVRDYTVDVIRSLGLKNCFCHVELRYDSQGRPSVIEVNPRIGGMRVSDSFKTLANVDYADTFIRQTVGQPVDKPVVQKPEGLYGMMALYPRRGGVLRRITGLEQASAIPGMVDIAGYARPGDRVGGDYEEVFVVDAWFKGNSVADIHRIDEQIRAQVAVEVEVGA